jgi:hypothetical protein
MNIAVESRVLIHCFIALLLRNYVLVLPHKRAPTDETYFT